jgi:ectoine hydroxylase-related dioxygenase (phytanoyl-CoA dioxygenase family)
MADDIQTSLPGASPAASRAAAGADRAPPAVDDVPDEGRILAPEVVARYRRDGYVKIDHLLHAESLQQLQQACSQPTTDGDHLVEARASGVAPMYAHQSHENYRRMWSNTFDLRLQNPELVPLVRLYTRVAAELLGEPSPRLLWDKTFAKPPAAAGTRQTVWHQDLPQVPVDRRGFLTIWVAVDDVPEESGALRFVPRSKWLGPLGRFDLVGAEPDLEDILTDEDRMMVGKPVTVPLRAGEATVHDGLTLHGAGENLSTRPRVGWTLSFVPAASLWTGLPLPQADLNELGLTPYHPFDHPRFVVD